MIYRIDHEPEPSTYVISSHDVWREGVYDSERTARYAFQFDDEVLLALQNSVNPDGVITFEMLRQTRKGGSARDGG